MPPCYHWKAQSAMVLAPAEVDATLCKERLLHHGIMKLEQSADSLVRTRCFNLALRMSSLISFSRTLNSRHREVCQDLPTYSVCASGHRSESCSHLRTAHLCDLAAASHCLGNWFGVVDCTNLQGQIPLRNRWQRQPTNCLPKLKQQRKK